MILIIDNYDSFTYNLVQSVRVLGQEVQVYRNDMIDCVGIAALQPSHIIISPGPGRPELAGCSIDVVKTFGGRMPLLGVCLGHQAIAVAFGGTVIAAERLVHGKTSMIHHDGKAIYKDMPKPFCAARYHSLIVDEEALPEDLVAVAHSERKELMGIRHKYLPIEGVQIHPESYLTVGGQKLIKNFVESY